MRNDRIVRDIELEIEEYSSKMDEMIEMMNNPSSEKIRIKAVEGWFKCRKMCDRLIEDVQFAREYGDY